MTFKYGDNVKVNKGFYEGLNGYVEDYRIEDAKLEYYVKMEGLKGTSWLMPSDWIIGEYLEKR